MGSRTSDYNIPSNNRELQRVLEDFIKRSIITYQVITGNYSVEIFIIFCIIIITYQVITGNYSAEVVVARSEHIITYQVITGNYSIVMKYKSHEVL